MAREHEDWEVFSSTIEYILHKKSEELIKSPSYAASGPSDAAQHCALKQPQC